MTLQVNVSIYSLLLGFGLNAKRTGSGITINSTYTYQCYTGFELLDGSVTRVITCKDDGSWDRKAAECHRKLSG